jgi:hypothetical protein
MTLMLKHLSCAMPSYASFVVLATLSAFTLGNPVKHAISQPFVKPAYSPFSASSNYVGQNNGTLPKTNVTAGKVFDRFIQIWMENTDFQMAASAPEFQALMQEGVLLDVYYAVTHVRRFPLKLHLVYSDPCNGY